MDDIDDALSAVPNVLVFVGGVTVPVLNADDMALLATSEAHLQVQLDIVERHADAN